MNDETQTLCAESAAELNNLTAHMRFGALAADAFKSWCTGATKPRLGSPGIVPRDGVWADRGYGCCLIGAALLGKPASESDYEYSDARAVYGLLNIETDDLWDGFDNALDRERKFVTRIPKNPSDAYRFGRDARVLVEKIFGAIKR